MELLRKLAKYGNVFKENGGERLFFVDSGGKLHFIGTTTGPSELTGPAATQPIGAPRLPLVAAAIRRLRAPEPVDLASRPKIWWS